MSFFGRLGLFLAGVLTGTITTIYALRSLGDQSLFLKHLKTLSPSFVPLWTA